MNLLDMTAEKYQVLSNVLYFHQTTLNFLQKGFDSFLKGSFKRVIEYLRILCGISLRCQGGTQRPINCLILQHEFKAR